MNPYWERLYISGRQTIFKESISWNRVFQHIAARVPFKQHMLLTLTIGLPLALCKNSGNKAKTFQIYRTEDKTMKTAKDLKYIELNIDDLDTVVGGSVMATSDDSKFLYKHGLMSTSYSAWDLSWWNWEEYSAEVDAGWARAGITYVSKYIGVNEYWYHGTELTQEQAYAIVESLG